MKVWEAIRPGEMIGPYRIIGSSTFSWGRTERAPAEREGSRYWVTAYQEPVYAPDDASATQVRLATSRCRAFLRRRKVVAAAIGGYDPRGIHVSRSVEYLRSGTRIYKISQFRPPTNPAVAGLSPRALLLLAQSLAASVAFLDSRGVVHGRIGPRTVSLSAGAGDIVIPYLLDSDDGFRMGDGPDEQFPAGPATAPELATRDPQAPSPPDGRCDVYSFAIWLAGLGGIEGTPACQFVGSSLADLLTSCVAQDPNDRPGAPEVDDWLRAQNPDDFAAALRGLVRLDPPEPTEDDSAGTVGSQVAEQPEQVLETSEDA